MNLRRTFDVEELLELPSVATVDYPESIDSTSDQARRLLDQHGQSAELPLLVITDSQTAGRGQPGKQWVSNSESLTFTWCVETNGDGSKAILPLLAGLAVCRACHQWGLESAAIKWPNDVLVDQKKIAGILVEQTKSGSRDVVLIGIGININQSAPETMQPTNDRDSATERKNSFPPTSVFQQSGAPLNLQGALTKVLEELSQCVPLGKQQQLATTTPATATPAMIERLNQHMLFRDQTITVELVGGETHEGVCTGVDRSGALLLRTQNGVRKVFSGTIVKSTENPA